MMKTIEERIPAFCAKLGLMAAKAKKAGMETKTITVAQRVLLAAAKSHRDRETMRLLYRCGHVVLELTRLGVRYRRLRKAGKIAKIAFYEDRRPTARKAA